MSRETDQRVIRTARLEIDPARRDAYLALLKDEIEASIRLEPGVIMLHATSPKHAPHRIELLEVYASQAAYEAHIALAAFPEIQVGYARHGALAAAGRGRTDPAGGQTPRLRRN